MSFMRLQSSIPYSEAQLLNVRVGHANFLDVLIDTLEPVDDDASPDKVVTTGSQSNTQDVDDNDAPSSDEGSDSSDDEDHALSRTVSASDLAKIARQETRTAIEEIEDDYFGLRTHGHAKQTSPSKVQGGEKEAVEVTVSAISLSSDDSDEPPDVEDSGGGVALAWSQDEATST